jgi:hypothetical protein
MIARILFPVLLTMLIAVSGCAKPFFTADQVKSMDVDQLYSRLDSPNTLVLDVRYGRTWTESNEKIKGARRADPAAFSQWADSFPKADDLVLY